MGNLLKIEPGISFQKQAKRLSRKYGSISQELVELGAELANDPFRNATPLGRDCYKIRLAIKSKGKGKSGGARVITCVKILQDRVVLLSIYDKSEKDTLTAAELDRLLRENNLE